MVRVDGQLLLIDWEHSSPGDPVYDLADLSVQADLPPEREQLFLEAYFAGAPEPHQLARFWMSKALSRFVWGAWALTRATAEPASTASAEAGARNIAQAMAFIESREGQDSARILTLRLTPKWLSPFAWSARSAVPPRSVWPNLAPLRRLR